jgi:hypothetical protein
MNKLFLAAALLASPALAQVEPEVIYGDDDRIDLHQVQNRKVLELADSTVALFQASDVAIEGAKARLSTSHYGNSMSLCKEEPFWDQVNGAFCSGSLVAPDILMTAGHCVRSESACQGTKFVFGFAYKTKGQNVSSVPASDVYSCRQLLGREEVGSGADWALIKLDRPVTGHKPLPVNKLGDPAAGTPLVVIGHPAGLPTKVAGGASVRDPSPDGYFVANLDTYGGNSGSAVFNAKTGLIEGILVRGEQDYVWRDSCRVSKYCGNDECRGEDVTKMTSVLPHLPGPMAAHVAPITQSLSSALEKLSFE